MRETFFFIGIKPVRGNALAGFMVDTNVVSIYTNGGEIGRASCRERV